MSGTSQQKESLFTLKKISTFESTTTKTTSTTENQGNESGMKVLGNTFGGGSKEVWEQNFENNPGQLWKKGETNTEGYFTLINSDQKHKSPQFMTAISANKLEIEGTYSYNSIIRPGRSTA